MDKKRLDHNGPRRSTYGENGAEKEAALDKLRQMEWKRNKIESWHLARPPTPPIEMKKTIKNEDYFGGTGIVKNKKGRKPRPEPGPPLAPAVPPGFAISAGSSACGPPPVNAWSQKKGSSLFNKGMPEEEEDEILLLVKKESMKTLEEDRKRQQERMLMMNKQVSPSTITTFADEPEAEWQTQEHGSDPDASSPTNSYTDQSSPIERNMNKSSSPINYSVPPPAFVDSDSAEEYPVKQTRKPERQRKSASPPTLPDQRNADRIQEKKYSKVPMISNYSDTDRFSPRAPDVGNIDRSYNPEMVPIKDQETVFSQRLATNRGMMIPEREDTGSKISGLADSFKSNLTFGDTQGLLESFQRGQSKSVPPIIDDVDLFLHNVIRHDPPVVSHDPGSPLQVEPDGIFQLDDTPKVLGSVVANIESEAQKDPNGGNPLEFAKMNGQAPSPQFSESSSSQSPFGSLGKQSYNYEPSPQTSPPVNQVPFPYGLTGNQDISNLVNQNMIAQMSAYMQRFAAPYPGVFPVPTINPLTGLAQFMPPMMMPTIPGQDMSNPLYQQLMLNNYYAQLALMQNQIQPVSTDAPSQTTPQTSEHQQTSQNFQNHQVQQNPQMPQLNNHIPQNYQNQQQILPIPGISPTLQNYAMNQNQPIPQIPENTPALQTHPMNQNQKMPENSLNTPALQNYPMNQNQQMPENTPALQNYPINQNQQMLENAQTLQNYPMNQNQQMPENTLQNYPMNQNQQMPENTLQNYPLNQNQQMPENTPTLQNYPMNQNQHMPENTLQNYPMNQNQQMPKNTMPLQNYPMNQNQQMPESTPTLQNYPMNQNQQMPENTPTLQNFPMVQNQQIPQHPLMPQNIPNLHNYPMNQNQQIPQNTQMPQNPLTQIPLYQAMLSQAHSQMIPSANPEHIVPENQDTCHPNQFPINSYQQPGQNNLNSVPQAGSAKNQDKIQALNQTLLQTLSQLQEMGGQLPVQMPMQVPVPGFYPPRMVQYPQMDQSMGHMQSSRHASPASSSPVFDGYDSSESREQAPPPAHNPSQFSQLPNVAPRGRGQGRRP